MLTPRAGLFSGAFLLHETQVRCRLVHAETVWQAFWAELRWFLNDIHRARVVTVLMDYRKAPDVCIISGNVFFIVLFVFFSPSAHRIAHWRRLMKRKISLSLFCLLIQQGNVLSHERHDFSSLRSFFFPSWIMKYGWYRYFSFIINQLEG